MIKLNLETKGYLQVRENIFDLSKNILSEFNIVYQKYPSVWNNVSTINKIEKISEYHEINKIYKKILDILEFNSIKGVVEAGVQKVSTVSGTGRWAEVVGVQCLGAYSTITPFEEGTLSNATAMWKGKCDVADKTLDRLINYKK